MIKINQLVKSFKYALRGMKKVAFEEQNFRIHLLAGSAVLILAGFFKLQSWEWIILIMLIAAVLILEVLNSILERLVDLLKPRIHDYVKEIKDFGAAIVFVAALAAVIIGLIIFIPHILK